MFFFKPLYQAIRVRPNNNFDNVIWKFEAVEKSFLRIKCSNKIFGPFLWTECAICKKPASSMVFKMYRGVKFIAKSEHYYVSRKTQSNISPIEKYIACCSEECACVVRLKNL